MELKYLDKLKCYRILSDSGGPLPLGGDRWLDGGTGRYGLVGRCPMHAHMHMHMHAHMHTCTCMLNMLNMLNMDASMLTAICNSIHVCVCACVHVHACACMWGHPHAPRYPQTRPHPPAPSPEPQGAQNTKFQ